MTMYFNRSVSDWVSHLHTVLCEIYSAPLFDISVDTYGYDSYAAVLVAVFENTSPSDISKYLRRDLDISRFVEIAHRAWSENYISWKNILPKPDVLEDDEQKSVATIGRNDRATSYVSNLNDDDLSLYHDIIYAVFNELSNDVIKAGMANLTV